MKKITIGVFQTRGAAEKAISHLHQELKLTSDNISYVYKNTEGKIEEVDTEPLEGDTPGEGAKKGAWVGGAAGALAGVAAVAGVIPVIGPVFAAGPLLAAVGIGGAAGVTAAGAVTGAVVGGLVGGLVNLGVQESKAKKYEDYVLAGDILVLVHADEGVDVAGVLMEHEAIEVEVFAAKI